LPIRAANSNNLSATVSGVIFAVAFI
jgi:hypothetical protein